MVNHNPFAGSDKQAYLDALNQALKQHPNYVLGMRFLDIQMRKQSIEFVVAPKGICSTPSAKKAFGDMADILTLSGSTLPFSFLDE